MELNLLLELMYKTPSATFFLVLALASTAALLVHQILKTEFNATMACIPAFLFAGLASYYFLQMNGVALADDRASNVALAATMGFTIAAIVGLIGMRVWARVQDKV